MHAHMQIYDTNFYYYMYSHKTYITTIHITHIYKRTNEEKEKVQQTTKKNINIISKLHQIYNTNK